MRTLLKLYDEKHTNIGLPFEFQILETVRSATKGDACQNKTVNCQLKNVLSDVFHEDF